MNFRWSAVLVFMLALLTVGCTTLVPLPNSENLSIPVWPTAARKFSGVV